MKEFWKNNYQGLEKFGWDVELFARRLLPSVMSKSVLELGCGNGLLSLNLASSASSVTGVEFAPEVADMAKRNVLQSEHADRVTIVEDDILKLDLQQRFDVICGTAIIHEINEADYDRLIEVLQRHLAPGGFIVFMENNFFNPFYRFVRKHMVGRFGLRKVGSADETPFDPQRWVILKSTFRFAERRGDIFVLFDRMWFQFFHYRLEPHWASLAKHLGSTATRIDRFVSARIGHNPVTLYWTWVPLLYLSKDSSYEQTFPKAPESTTRLIRGS